MSTFGRYTLVRKVGMGGMAEIWKAKAQGPQGFEKVLAIKKVLPHLVEDGEFIDMFVEEAKLVAGLVHPNIVQVFDFGQIGKKDYFIAMEYVPGANLAQVIRRLADRRARMPIEVALYVVLEACKGLGYAHVKTDAAGNEQGIVHRDVSPQNILVSFSGEVKVTDFGIAKVVSALTRTAEGHVRGKLAYMSPEQAHVKPLDNRSDLFSLGVVLYELVTGRRLFAGTSSSEIYSKVTEFAPPGPEMLAGIPEEVRAVLSMALQPDPEERFPDAMQMEAAVARSLGPEGIVQARHALASIVQRLFEDERRLETEVASVGPIPEAPEAAETVLRDSGELGVGGLASAVSPNPVPREPRRTPTNPSGLTLAKPVTGKQPVRVLREDTPPPEPEHETPARRAGGPLMILASAALILIAVAFFGGRYSGPSGATPTPLVVATVTIAEEPPAVVASAAPSVVSTSTPSLALDATPIPIRTRTIVAHTPVPVPTRVASVAQTGLLSVNAKPWVQVFVDGKLVASETPLRRFSLPAGKHVIRFVNPKFTTESSVDIAPGAERSFFVDVNAKSVRSDNQNR